MPDVIVWHSEERRLVPPQIYRNQDACLFVLLLLRLPPASEKLESGARDSIISQLDSQIVVQRVGDTDPKNQPGSGLTTTKMIPSRRPIPAWGIEPRIAVTPLHPIAFNLETVHPSLDGSQFIPGIFAASDQNILTPSSSQDPERITCLYGGDIMFFKLRPSCVRLGAKEHHRTMKPGSWYWRNNRDTPHHLGITSVPFSVRPQGLGWRFENIQGLGQGQALGSRARLRP
ncbi:hypothetical protein C8R46DRAFT_1295110 [Mycena filopes]|nr:hypothetical protein C8R46DRAFT_1295110 [Mycena filopes]